MIYVAGQALYDNCVSLFLADRGTQFVVLGSDLVHQSLLEFTELGLQLRVGRRQYLNREYSRVARSTHPNGHRRDRYVAWHLCRGKQRVQPAQVRRGYGQADDWQCCVRRDDACQMSGATRGSDNRLQTTLAGLSREFGDHVGGPMGAHHVDFVRDIEFV